MILTIIKIIGLSFVISKFHPLQWVIETLDGIIKNTSIRLLFNLFTLMVTCFNCLCLWIGFIMGGFWIGILTYILSYVYSHSILSSWEKIYI